MAIRIEQKRALNAVELVSVNDDAIDTENSNIEEYQKTGDLVHLKYLPDKAPTIFLMNFEHKGKEGAMVKNAMLEGKDENGAPTFTVGSWAYKIVKLTLKDIKNPPDLPEDCRLVYRKDDRGYAHDETIAKMDRYGIVEELFAFYSKLALTGAKSNAKNS